MLGSSMRSSGCLLFLLAPFFNPSDSPRHFRRFRTAIDHCQKESTMFVVRVIPSDSALLYRLNVLPAKIGTIDCRSILGAKIRQRSLHSFGSSIRSMGWRLPRRPSSKKQLKSRACRLDVRLEAPVFPPSTLLGRSNGFSWLPGLFEVSDAPVSGTSRTTDRSWTLDFDKSASSAENLVGVEGNSATSFCNESNTAKDEATLFIQMRHYRMSTATRNSKLRRYSYISTDINIVVHHRAN